MIREQKNRQYLRNAEPVAEYEKTDTLPKTILFIGDSMLEGLSPRFAAYAQENGHRLYTVIWYGSTTEKWAESRRLTSYIAQYHPDFIVVCLGGNELFVKDIIEKRTKYADAIIAEAGEVPLLWIGPPNWKEDTGINRMLLSALGNKRFYESKDLILDRAKRRHASDTGCIARMDGQRRALDCETVCISDQDEQAIGNNSPCNENNSIDSG